jgi:hypothetical protein
MPIEKVRDVIRSVNAANFSKLYVQVGVKWVDAVFKHGCVIANNKEAKTIIILLIDNNLNFF